MNMHHGQVTKGLLDRFGEDRVIDVSPPCPLLLPLHHIPSRIELQADLGVQCVRIRRVNRPRSLNLDSLEWLSELRWLG